MAMLPLREIKSGERVDYMPITNKSINNYRQYFNLSSVSSTTSSGNTEAFISETTVEIKPSKTLKEPFNVSDFLSVKGGSTNTSISISNFFPADDGAVGSISDESLVDKFKDLSEVTLNLDVKPKELTSEQLKQIALSANFNVVASTKLEIYTESSSPTFVSSFQDIIFNKKLITR
jgi:hypothetical protein